MRVLDAIDAHIASISAIWEAGWHEAHGALVPEALRVLRTTESFRARSSEQLAATRVAVRNGNVVGFCMVHGDEL